MSFPSEGALNGAFVVSYLPPLCLMKYTSCICLCSNFPCLLLSLSCAICVIGINTYPDLAPNDVTQPGQDVRNVRCESGMSENGEDDVVVVQSDIARRI